MRSGYAARRDGAGLASSSQQQGGLSTLSGDGHQHHPPSSFSLALNTLSSSLPNLASLTQAFRSEAGGGGGGGGGGAVVLRQIGSVKGENSYVRRGPMNSYYSRRIGSAQYGSRHVNRFQLTNSSNDLLGQPRSSLPASSGYGASTETFSSAGGNHEVKQQHSSLGNLMSAPYPSTLPTPVPVAAPLKPIGPSVSPIQTKKKSVRWVDMEGKGAGTLSVSAAPTPTAMFVHQKHGHEVLVLKSSLAVGGVKDSSKINGGSAVASVGTSALVRSSIEPSSSHALNGAKSTADVTAGLHAYSKDNFRPSTAPIPAEKDQSVAAAIPRSGVAGTMQSVPSRMNRSISLNQFTAPQSSSFSSMLGAGQSSLSTASYGHRSSLRPSLSDQLAAIGSEAASLTLNIRQKAGLTADSESDPPLFVFPTKNLSIGTLNCRYPSPARFFRDRIEYVFHHPFESMEVEMHMYYRDILQPIIVGGKLRFKLPRRLIHFLSDFDPSNHNHVVSIELGKSHNDNCFYPHFLVLVGYVQYQTD